MDYVNTDALVSGEWLQEHMYDPNVRIIDATWYSSFSDNDAWEEYEFRHIPGAIFWDADDITDLGTSKPHTTPDENEFAEAVGALGIGNDHHVVVYDAAGGYLVAMRVWWMLKMFGHDKVSVLNGGLQRWIRDKRPVTDEIPKFPETTFETNYRDGMIHSMAQMLSNLHTNHVQVVDVRNPKRFSGEEPDPSAVDFAKTLNRKVEARIGHIPKAMNVPLASLMNPLKQYMVRPADEVVAAFKNAGVDMDRPMVSMCATGCVAAVVPFVLYMLGHEMGAIYEGSWAEWANFDGTPAETDTP